MIRPALLLLALLLAGLASARAQAPGAEAADAPVIQLRTIAIIGNRELPKTLVIVPWKDAVTVPVPTPDIESVLDAPAQALDPADLELQVELFRAGYVLD